MSEPLNKLAPDGQQLIAAAAQYDDIRTMPREVLEAYARLQVANVDFLKRQLTNLYPRLVRPAAPRCQVQQQQTGGQRA